MRRTTRVSGLVASDRLEDRTLLAGAPILAMSPSPAEYTENAPPIPIAPELTVVDDDSPTLVGASVRISSGFQAGGDRLSFTSQGGITGSYDPAAGVLTLAGAAPVEEYQAALRSIGYENTSDNPSPLERTITFEVHDSLETGTATKRIVVAAVNDAPIAAGERYTVAEGGSLSVAAATRMTITPIEELQEGGRTLNKPQSKVWKHDNTWWALLGFNDATGTGTAVYRLVDVEWIRELVVYEVDALADVMVAGDVVHVLLEKGAQTRLASLEYVDGSDGSPGFYQFWSARPELANLGLPAGMETATIDIDSTGRMWVAYDDGTAVRVKYSDGPYAFWSDPVTLEPGVPVDDITAVAALPGGAVGVFWSNQSTQRFGFRTHVDGTDPTVWTPDEAPAADEALNVNLGLADDHVNLAAASDGTLYVAIKTGYDQAGLPLTSLLVRRPNGVWDPLYTINDSGTRGIVQLNDETRTLMIIYRDGDNIVYNLAKDDGLQVTVEPEQILITDSTLLNSPSGSKHNFTDDLVVLASREGVVSAVHLSYEFGILANDRDAEADPLTAVLAVGPSHGSLTLQPDGAFTYIHDGSEAASDSFTYQLYDGIGPGGFATVDISVTPVNDPPAAASDEYSVVRGGTLYAADADGSSGNARDDGVLVNDSDPENDSLTARLVGGPAFGSLTFYADGTFVYTHDGSGNLSDSFSYVANDAAADSSPVTVLLDINTGPNARTGVVSGVTSTAWSTVTLDRSYESMVVIATPNYDSTSVPLVTRIRNAAGNSFEVKLDRVDGLAGGVPGIDVYYLVVEEGVYTQQQHGVTMEAVKFVSTLTDYHRSRVGQRRDYENAYTNPVVVGQVMTAADADFSVFWSRGSHKDEPPTATDLFVGKHTGEDPDHTRADETIGYIVIESGSGQIDGRDYLAAVGPDIVRGVVSAKAYSYDLSGLEAPATAVVSMAAMNGNDGGWAVLYGAEPVSDAGLHLAIDEDQINDRERNHTDERVAFIAFGPDPPNVRPFGAGDSYRAVQGGMLVADDVTGLLGDANDNGVLANDVDPNGDPLTAQLVTPPVHGSLELYSDGSFVYVHNGSAAESDSFTYRAFDGVDYSDPTLVDIVIEAAPQTVSFRNGLAGYAGTMDASIVFDAPAVNFGADDELAMDGSPDRAALIAWDLTSVDSASTVLAASITINVANPSSDLYEIYAVARPWLEDEVTWQESAAGAAWQTAGAVGVGDRGTQVIGHVTAPSKGTVTVELNAAGVDVVQSWISNPATNFGLIFQDYANATSNGLEFSSSEAATVGNRPMLVITYVSGGELAPNAAPVVSAGMDQAILLGDPAQLNGSVSDDGLPNHPGFVTTTWSVVDGPGPVAFADSTAAATTAEFSVAGTYILRLAADDGDRVSADELVVTVAAGSETWSLSFRDGSNGYAGTADATLVAGLPGTNFGNLDQLEMDGAPDEAALIRWDLSSVAPGSMAVAAAITVNVTNRSDDFFGIYGVMKPWIEDQVTWLEAADGLAWTTAGASADADRNPAAVGQMTAPAEGLVTVELNVTGVALVQSWLDDAESNHGLIFQTYVGAGNGLDFSSSEAANVALRPMLTVTFADSPGDGGQALFAAVEEPYQRSGAEPAVELEHGQLSDTVTEATDRWLAVLEPEQAALASRHLNNVRFEIDDLPGHQLGVASNGTIRIDTNAAGRGWFIDSTPRDDSEFVRQGAGGELAAGTSSPAFGRFDLLTVVMHELGHLFGYGHADGDDVMQATLKTGRRMPPGLHPSAVEENSQAVDLAASDALFEAFLMPAESLLGTSGAA